mmetsp:Transcript_53497/g.142132  ORF Transcript_53497/g.142132 Transcript_53497/m.142132 type:complete len:650 (-) Transcript_53497:217-2166(-)
MVEAAVAFGLHEVQQQQQQHKAAPGPPYTVVDPSIFVTPFQPLSRSGGTAAFYRTTLREEEDDGTATKTRRRRGISIVGPPRGASADVVSTVDCWIGKDIAHALGEVAFYEEARLVRSLPGWEMLRWLLGYKGVCCAPCQVEEVGDPRELELMLLRNCRDGFKSCRLLDVKIGQVTAVRDWHGKSAFAAWRQSFVDAVTNSVRQGFRLEGLDNPPVTVRSMYAKLEEGIPSTVIGVKPKRLKRLYLQGLTGLQFVSHFLSLHDAPDSTFARRSERAPSADTIRPPAFRAGTRTFSSSQDTLTNVEIQELVLLGCIEELARLVAALRSVPVPQQWIGSSVMLAFDAGARPDRDGTGVPVRVHIFDWGRAELNTPERYAAMTEEDRASRRKYWGYYCGGIAKLLYDCCHLYVIRFFHPKQSVALTMYHKHTWKADGFIGTCALPLKEAAGGDGVTMGAAETVLDTWFGKPVKSGIISSKEIKLGVSVLGSALPSESRLRSRWLVHVHGAQGLPRRETFAETDSVVEVSGMSEGVQELHDALSDPGARQALRNAAHSTTVATGTRDPEFDETIEIGTLREDCKAEFLLSLGVAVGRVGVGEDAVLEWFPHVAEQGCTRGELQSRFAQTCFPEMTCSMTQEDKEAAQDISEPL